MFCKRINRLRKKLGESKIDVALFLTAEPIHDVNIQYFTDFQQETYHSFACFLVTQKSTTLILSSLDYNRANGKEADEVVEKKAPLADMLNSRIKKKQVIGVIEALFPYKLSKKFRRIRDITGIVSGLRSVKEPEEIEAIRKACNITNRGIKFITGNLEEGLREKELALELERFLSKMGAEGMSFPTIVTSSKRSAQIHPFPSFSNQRIKRGLGYVDFGVRYKGYCSDVTVPFSVGTLTEKERKIADTVKESYTKSLETLRNGIETWKIYEAAERVIKERDFELKHGLGHGLGLEVHDAPSISPKPEKTKDWKEVKIRKNMTFTIEPGVYVPGVGGSRLENDFLMKRKGFEVLTKSKFFKI